ncbi:hypothetical protein ABVT39_008922 [Epinephelus coioides]
MMMMKKRNKHFPSSVEVNVQLLFPAVSSKRLKRKRQQAHSSNRTSRSVGSSREMNKQELKQLPVRRPQRQPPKAFTEQGQEEYTRLRLPVMELKALCIHLELKTCMDADDWHGQREDKKNDETKINTKTARFVSACTCVYECESLREKEEQE